MELQDEQRDRDSEHGVGARLKAGNGQQADLRAPVPDDAVPLASALTRLRAIAQRIASSSRVRL
jgi:hypothetical protein